LINAAESIQRKGITPGQVRIQAAVERRDGRELKHIQICDSGEGIEPQILERIFERGFSSKPKSASGIGLHWCANTISAMKGCIYAESKGRDQGACMHLLLP
jgi:sensor histidine kinase regulating citrate/malate metabolism